MPLSIYWSAFEEWGKRSGSTSEGSLTSCGAIYHYHCSVGLVERRRRFPPKIRLLTEEEYQQQATEETKKALDELRNFCRSPDCHAWKTMSRLNSPARYSVIHSL